MTSPVLPIFLGSFVFLILLLVGLFATCFTFGKDKGYENVYLKGGNTHTLCKVGVGRMKFIHLPSRLLGADDSSRSPFE
jgi:hypothetical protein